MRVPRRFSESRRAAGSLALVSLAAASAIRCGPALGISDSSPGGGTAGARAGASNGAGTSGAMFGGSGGFGGASGGASITPGGAGAGDSGAGGSDVGPRPPRLGLPGEPCEPAGSLACHENDGKASLVCEGGVWLERPCAAEQSCDRALGACGNPVSQCSGPGQKYCRTDSVTLERQLVTCGVDNVTLEIETCLLDCDDAALRCVTPVGDVLIVDQPPAIAARNAFWPLRQIPVCVSDAGLAVWEALREAIDRSWGHTADLAFTGWGECSDGEPGIHLRLESECRDRLGSIDRVGYPGPGGALSIGLCTSYFDAENLLRTADPRLIELVARHELGHALGFSDVPYSSIEFDFMARAIQSSRLDDYGFGLPNSALAEGVYGRRASGALFGARGRCWSASGLELTPAICDGSPEQRFRLTGRQLRHEGSGSCVTLGTDDALALDACAPDPLLPGAARVWELPRAQIRSYGGLCLAHAIEPRSNTPELRTEPCAGFGDGDQTFGVIFDPIGQIRIANLATNRCIAAPARGIMGPARPLLTTCSALDARQYFRTTSEGQIHYQGSCLFALTLGGPAPVPLPRSEVVSMLPCSDADGLRFHLAGPFVNGAGQAVTRSAEGDSARLTATTLEDPPSEAQIFDFRL